MASVTLSAVRTTGGRERSAAELSSCSQRRFVLAVDEDAVNDVDAQEEDAQRPPRVGAADRQQCPDRAEAAADDPDDPAVGVAGYQRKTSGELDHTEDDQNPAEGVEVAEDEPL